MFDFIGFLWALGSVTLPTVSKMTTNEFNQLSEKCQDRSGLSALRKLRNDLKQGVDTNENALKRKYAEEIKAPQHKLEESLAGLKNLLDQYEHGFEYFEIQDEQRKPKTINPVPQGFKTYLQNNPENTADSKEQWQIWRKNEIFQYINELYKAVQKAELINVNTLSGEEQKILSILRAGYDPTKYLTVLDAHKFLVERLCAVYTTTQKEYADQKDKIEAQKEAFVKKETEKRTKEVVDLETKILQAKADYNWVLTTMQPLLNQYDPNFSPDAEHKPFSV